VARTLTENDPAIREEIERERRVQPLRERLDVIR
jgi:hypothetical protein